MTRHITLEEFGDPGVLKVREGPEPEPDREGYVVEVRAAGVNFADTLERRGAYRRDQPLPYPMGKEAAGVVVARGPEAREFALGDTVLVVKFDNGCYAEHVAAGSHQVLPPPRGMDFPQLAAFANTFATAWYALREVARVRPGESLLVQAAAGGVGTATVELARSLGLDPILGTAGGPVKCALVEGLGAARCIDYRKDDFLAAVREHTDGRGVDVCVESVGGEVYERSLKALAPLGRMVVLGFSSIREAHAGAIRRLHPLTLLHRSIGVAGLNMDQIDYPRDRATWSALVEHVERHDLRPVVGETFPLEKAADAHAHLEGRRSTGKLVLVP